MKKLFLLSALAVLFFCSATPPPVKFKDFQAVQPKGNVLKLSDFVGKGKYVVVDFFASWCGPCMAETPYLKAAYNKYSKDKLTIVSVAVADRPEDTMKAVKQHGISWNVIMNAQNTPGRLYGFRSIPQIYLFGPDGTLLETEGLRGPDLDKTLSKYIK